MNFRQTKLLLAMALMAMGMVIALIWHGWQSWILHRDYPYSTFLYVPAHRFDDLTQIKDYARLPSPYQSIWGGYLPVSYKFAGALSYLSPVAGTFLYLGMGSLGLWITTILAVRPMILNQKRLLLSECSAIWVATGLTWLSYPLLLTLDRANLELIMALLIALALICFQGRRHDLGLICLFPAICFKLYPCLLLSLFLRPGHLLKICFLGLMVVIANVVSFASYAGTMEENWHLWHRNLHFMNDFYVIADGQLHGSASPWNAGKAFLETFCYAKIGMISGARIILAKDIVEKFYIIFSYFSLASVFVVVAYSVLVETEFFRRAIALLIIMTLCVPSGGDYRLLYADMAMVILILVISRRRHDLFIVCLLAFAIVPKREIIFPFMGICDTGFSDTSLGTLLNAPCLLAALVLFMRDGCRDNAPRFWRQKLLRIVNLPLTSCFGASLKKGEQTPLHQKRKWGVSF